MSNISLSVAERNVVFFTKGFALWISRWDAEIVFFTKVFFGGVKGRCSFDSVFEYSACLTY
jgi:hypothetical protein